MSETLSSAPQAGEPTRRLAGPDEPHGRGLHIVHQLSEDWGVEANPEGGKTVWVDIVIQRT